MSGVGSTSNLTATYEYIAKFIYNEGGGGEASLTLSEMLRTPPVIFETYNHSFMNYANNDSGIYMGFNKGLITINLKLMVKSIDPRDMELQIREIKNFFAAAPSQMVTFYWADSSSKRARCTQCALEQINPDRFSGALLFGGQPAINLVLASTQKNISYTESGDPAPTDPDDLGPRRHRVTTNNSSTAVTIVNDVTGKTLFTLDDQGQAYLRKSLIQESEDLV